MTHIDFYLLTDAREADREKFACRLTEKIYKLGHPVYVLTETAEDARRFDGLLWTFRDGSFIPHEQYSKAGEHRDSTPVLVSHDRDADMAGGILINLARDMPMMFSRFERVAEIIADDEQQKQAARERYRFYRDRGYALKTHTIPGKQMAVG